MTSKTTASAGKRTAARAPFQDIPKASENQLETLTTASIEAVRTARELVEKLAAERAAQKLSKTRVSQVARELREIMKALTRYCTA